MFIPFDNTRTIIHFHSRVPNDWERKHLPVILITGDTWNPTEEVMQYEKHSREAAEMRMIHSLTSGSDRRQIWSVSAHLKPYEQDITPLSNISTVYDSQCFCECLVSAVNIATTY